MIQNESLTTKWYRAKHVIKTAGSQDFIAIDPETPVEFYSPLAFELPERQPKEPGAQERLSPVLAAANLDLTDTEKILTFVNIWGMLGLWDDQKYELPVQQEPLHKFVEAVNDFQSLMGDIAGQADDWPEKGGVIANFIYKHLYYTKQGIQPDPNRVAYLWVHHFRNLQAAIYLRLAIFLTEGKVFHRCKRDRCGKYFVSESSENVYCSVRCRSAQSTAISRKKQWEKTLLENAYNYITTRRDLSEEERTRLLELARREIDALLTQQGVGIKTIGRKVLVSIDEELKKLYGKT